MKQVVSVAYHNFAVGGDTDIDDVDVLTALGKPGQSMVLVNNAAIALYFQFSSDGDTWSDRFYISPVVGYQHRIDVEDGVKIYKTRVYSAAINGYYSMQIYPGLDETVVPNIRVNEGETVRPLDETMPEIV